MEARPGDPGSSRAPRRLSRTAPLPASPIPTPAGRARSHDPFGAEMDAEGTIFGRGAQDMKCVGMAYLEAIRALKASGFVPRRTLAVSFVPDEEIGGLAGMGAFVQSAPFAALSVGLELDEGWASEGEHFPVFYAERTAWWVVVKASGQPGHGSKLYDGGAMEALHGAVGRLLAFRKSEFDKVKAGAAAPGDVVSVNLAYLRGGVAADQSAPCGDAKFVMNLQPAAAEAGFDIRIPPTVDLAHMEARLRTEFAPPSLNLSVSFVSKSAAKLRPDGTASATSLDEATSPWWSAFRASLSASGLAVVPEIFPAATDASYLRSRGVPSLGFSPLRRTPRLLHEHDERLGAGVYLEGVEIYRSLLKDLSSLPRHEGDGPAAGGGAGAEAEEKTRDEL